MIAEFLPSRLPIIQAPMAGSQGIELCAAVPKRVVLAHF
jgi:NAD(P)H-dependent flavin oxidoreductase YrpB (nitropropane dioxygenase family)